MKHIDSTLAFYEALEEKGYEGKKARIVLLLRNWLNEVFQFDPRSGRALTQGMDEFLCSTAKFCKELLEFYDGAMQLEMPKDRVYRIVDHIDEAFLAILRQMRTKVTREHPILPLHAVREIDSKTMMWLSKKPGRNVREKLQGRPYIKAVKRKSSFDTSENRLLMAFVTDLVKILSSREDIFNIDEDVLCRSVYIAAHNWLKSEGASDIGSWKNLQPNNVLLNDFNYRKIWDAWLWSQRLDHLASEDFRRLHYDALFYLLINLVSALVETGQLRIVQQPLRIVSQDLNLTPISQIKGYLFDALPPNRNTGIISRIYPDKGYGFIETRTKKTLIFHESYLLDTKKFMNLNVSSKVSFVIGTNTKGECAKKIDCIVAEEPKEVNFTFKEDQFVSTFKSGKITVFSELDGFSIQYGSGKKRQQFDYSINSFKKGTDVMYERITGKAVDDFKYASESSQTVPIPSEFSIIDLYSIRPQFSVDGGARKNFPFRLLMQYWLNGVYDYVVVDCSYAKAIKLHPDVQSISMRNLFSKDEISPQAFKSETTMTLIGKISKYLVTSSLYYLVPDRINDFEFKNIRKQINYRYEHSSPIPKSIAAILAWQSSKKFDLDKLRVNDFVLVIDLLDDGISITPVKGLYSKELKELVPETRGFYWERHPTQVFRSNKIASSLSRKLSQDGCPHSEELFRLFGYEGLTSDADSLSVVEEATWYHLHLNHNEMLPDDSEIASFLKKVINQSVEDIVKLNMKAGVYLLPLHNIIRKVQIKKKTHWLGYAGSIFNGAEKLLKWQKEAGELVLWKDHLPNLAFDNIPQQITRKFFWWGKFYLVKNKTLIPQRGKQISISVKEHFTLPAGSTDYRFPLLQGEGNNELEFVAYLKSPAFPLKEDVTCELKMTYTYGADDPYELTFIPLNLGKAGFKFVRVEWRSALEGGTTNIENLAFPVFPVRRTWSDFQKFPKEDGSSFSNLLEWVSDSLQQLDPKNLYEAKLEYIFKKELEWEQTSRVEGCFEWGAIDKKGEEYCRVMVNEESIFCHSSNFIEHISVNDLSEGQTVFLRVMQGERDKYGMHISFHDRFPAQLERNIKTRLKLKMNFNESRLLVDNADWMKKRIFSIRFPTLTIWNHGHSLSETDVPDHFKKALLKGIQKALSIIKSEDIPDTLKEELFFFLSCLHKDSPVEVVHRLVSAIKETGFQRQYYRNIAFAIGDAELPWQQELLNNTINPANDNASTLSIMLQILAIALWRSQELIFKFTGFQIEDLSSKLLLCLESDVRKVAHDRGGYQVIVLCMHLELLLALVRTREFRDNTINNLVAPDRDITKRYILLIDSITKIIVENNIEIRSRIALQIEKPEMFKRIPDLLYALRMYLTGDSWADTIVIIGISDD